MTTLGQVSANRELLEGSTPAARPPGYLANNHGLSPAPIPGDWIIEGKPLARNRRIAGSTDGFDIYVGLYRRAFFPFPKGTRFEWTVHSYVRKVAFIHEPVSGKLPLFMRMCGAVMGLLRGPE